MTDEDRIQVEIFVRALDCIRRSVDADLSAKIGDIVSTAMEEQRAHRRRVSPAASADEFDLTDQLEAYRGALYKLNHMANIDGRVVLADILAATVNEFVERAPDTGNVTSAVSSLTSQGCCRIDELLTRAQSAAVVGYFDGRPCYNGHTAFEGDKVARRIGAGAEAFHYGSYSTTDIVRAPHLVEAANHPELLASVEGYLGCTPTLYSLNAWWSFPGKSEAAPVAQSFHRDRDDARFCTLFVYLTDVDRESDPNVYLRRTHRRNLIEQRLAAVPEIISTLGPSDRRLLADGTLFGSEGYGTDRLIEQIFADQIEANTGPAGTAFLADTYGYHKGAPPKSGRRLMFWARYGMRQVYPAAHRVSWTLLADRLRANARSRYINRGVFGS